MKCEVCNETISGKRSDSRYCSTTCRNKAYQLRSTDKDENELEETYPNEEIEIPELKPIPLNVMEELRRVEREHFNTILDLKTDYGDKIRALQEVKLKNEFTIDKLKDKISDLKDDHTRELAKISTNTTKDTVTAITQMPAIQSVLGTLANNLIPSGGNSLEGVADQFNVQEKQIIDAIRRMESDAQGYLIQMLYFLFAKNHDEQMEIFTTLQSFMMPTEENEDVDI
ncbi:hypothetical protein GCQ56_14035 [Marinifilum sp. N1E240]|uniref:hypothetical protein n=1 Tax=Marinifilum sp. N1E240 TaxID=2608082 RepID=UPI00128B5366|nr:hypothetical protein [Marinifilum sp. N1E240]MPQ48122.1 hypothetical protein [Marinifilum sp. N1E240]